MFDHHLHVWTHGPGTPQPSYDQLARYCEAAAAVGVEQIAITEHSHRFDRVLREVSPHWRRPLTGEAAEATAHVLAVEGGGDLDRYVATLVDAQERGLPLLVGLEVDWWPGADRAMAAVLDDYPFDVLLGSVHWIDEWLFDAYDTPAFARRRQRQDLVDIAVEHRVDLGALPPP
ncbi:MAG: PHP domain-containing protein, partial [Actinomycetota bacterium]